MNAIDKLAQTILESQKDKSPKPYDTEAVVTRVNGDTAYVHIPGGVEETPARMTVSARKGDTVRVRISGSRAYVIGNASAPPTDDTKAITADEKAVKAQTEADRASAEAMKAKGRADSARAAADTAGKVAKDASKAASEAYRIAGNTNQYFWVTQEGTDTGAHITEKTQEAFLDDPTGGNLLARSNGIALRDGLTELATFGANTIEVGKNSKNSKIYLCDGTGIIEANDTGFGQITSMLSANGDLLDGTTVSKIGVLLFAPNGNDYASCQVDSGDEYSAKLEVSSEYGTSFIRAYADDSYGAGFTLSYWDSTTEKSASIVCDPESGITVSGCANIVFNIDDTASSGTDDYKLYHALLDMGWTS